MDTDLSQFVGVGIVALVIYLVVLVGLVLLAIRVMYSIIWRSVRRGLREFYRQNPAIVPYMPNPPIAPPYRGD